MDLEADYQIKEGYCTECVKRHQVCTRSIWMRKKCNYCTSKNLTCEKYVLVAPIDDRLDDSVHIRHGDDNEEQSINYNNNYDNDDFSPVIVSGPKKHGTTYIQRPMADLRGGNSNARTPQYNLDDRQEYISHRAISMFVNDPVTMNNLLRKKKLLSREIEPERQDDRNTHQSTVGARMEPLIMTPAVFNEIDQLDFSESEYLDRSHDWVRSQLAAHILTSLNPLYAFASILCTYDVGFSASQFITLVPDTFQMNLIDPKKRSGSIAEDLGFFFDTLGEGITDTNKFHLLKFLSQGLMSILPSSVYETSTDKARSNIYETLSTSLTTQKKDDTAATIQANNATNLKILANLDEINKNNKSTSFNTALVEEWKKTLDKLIPARMNVGKDLEPGKVIGLCFLTPLGNGLVERGFAKVTRWAPRMRYTREELMNTDVLKQTFAELCAFISPAITKNTNKSQGAGNDGKPSNGVNISFSGAARSQLLDANGQRTEFEKFFNSSFIRRGNELHFNHNNNTNTFGSVIRSNYTNRSRRKVSGYQISSTPRNLPYWL